MNEVQRRIEEISRSVAFELPDSNHFTLPLLEWIHIPEGNITLEGGAGLYPVEPFAIAKYPVTNAQFQAFIDDGGYRNKRNWIDLARREAVPARPQWTDPTRPRETVNWYEAMAFCRWLSAKVGMLVTLPTEMQWQWAAVGNKGWSYPYGHSFDTKKGNTSESRIDQTTPVDYYPRGASAFGVMDMSGNVWEWCLNEFANPQQRSTAGEQSRALRGGSWDFDRSYALATYRLNHGPISRSYNAGFRMVIVRPAST
jgi:formylglycine-generating enzyme required for sulfatase activity